MAPRPTLLNPMPSTCINTLISILREQHPLLLTSRDPASHKGSHGIAWLIGGATGMTGALVLAATACQTLGCGKTIALFAQDTLPCPYLPKHPEIMLGTADTLAHTATPNVIAIGCGLGLDDRAQSTLTRTLQYAQAQHIPLIIDADALTLLAQQPLPTAEQSIILTPHPAEAARLLNTSTDTIQRDRTTAVLTLANRYHAHVILKGQHSLIATAHGDCHTNHSGDASLATAGSGDVLTGIITALIAQYQQQYPLTDILHAAVWLHGAAAQMLGNGPPPPHRLTRQ